MELEKINELSEIGTGKKYKVPNLLIDLFFPNQGSEKRRIAAALLCEIRNRRSAEKPFCASDGREFCKNHSFSYWTYQDVRERLEKARVLKKDGSEFRITLHPFIEILEQLEDFLNFETIGM